jgi:hypothetical protein
MFSNGKLFLISFIKNGALDVNDDDDDFSKNFAF